MNKCIFIGNLTRDPELRTTNNGDCVANFTIAVSRDCTRDGVRETDFFSVTVWRGLAENCAKFLKKGNKVAVSGSIQNRTYEDREGIKRSVTEIVANDVQFLTPREHRENENDSRLPF